jgi:arylsulfatase A-like enzyme
MTTAGFVPPPAQGRGGAAAPPPGGPRAGATAPIPTWRALRTRTHKYAVYFNGDLSELYDLRSDPRETRNLILDPKQQKLAAELHKRLLQRAEETKDPLRSMIPTAPSLQQSRAQ